MNRHDVRAGAGASAVTLLVGSLLVVLGRPAEALHGVTERPYIELRHLRSQARKHEFQTPARRTRSSPPRQDHAALQPTLVPHKSRVPAVPALPSLLLCPTPTVADLPVPSAAPPSPPRPPPQLPPLPGPTTSTSAQQVDTSGPDTEPPDNSASAGAGHTGGPSALVVAPIDRPPRLVVETLPHYPPDAWRRRMEGHVIVRFVVKSDGRVGTIDVIESSGIPAFRRAAREAVRTWRFEPAIVDGTPAPVWCERRLTFDVRNR